MDSPIKRKGAKRISEIPSDILEKLNKGELETANLMEGLAIDNKILISNVLKSINRDKYVAFIWAKLDALAQKTITKINPAIGEALLELSIHHNDKEMYHLLATHTSDMVRGWAAYMVGWNKEISIEQKFEYIYPLASDSHFGVREFAWMVMRTDVIQNLEVSLEIIGKWALSEDENIRRFASELTRPRGVWCAHIEQLKTQPQKAFFILDYLKNDSSKYVQNSVANWLNDASKSQPDWVKKVCKQWLKESNTKATQYIVKRGTRNLEN